MGGLGGEVYAMLSETHEVKMGAGAFVWSVI